MDIHTNPSEATWTRNLVERSAKPVSELASELTRPLARAPVGPLSSGNRLSSLRMFCSKVDRSGAAAGLRSGGVQRALPEVGFGRAHSVGVGRRFYGRTVRLCRVTESAVLELGRWKERGDFRKLNDPSEENRAPAEAIRLLRGCRDDGDEPGNGKNFKQK
jgi:hypothetical protein